MLGFVHSAFGGFTREMYGEACWSAVNSDENGHAIQYQSLRNYPDQQTADIIARLSRKLNKPPELFIEDFGAWVARLEPIRRLLRFGGRDFRDFVIHLEDLPIRARTIVPDFHIPRIVVKTSGPDRFEVTLSYGWTAWTPLVAGILRGMADDYGSLVVIQFTGRRIQVEVTLDQFAAGREFEAIAGQPMRVPDPHAPEVL